ncbi:hypothetical protein [Nocardioides sp. zg-DK7169]|uniref:hypothetical protein n=1 Tax=Nocardioides sp. zg-DK7169 TaxID=2736600 RepID=UPI001555F7DD|nr:hypothetical protein [Nocardioides sp. zg-DK7169]NPC95533.1 hypothetical protein [Nocardioides sp. zg-DK7169]
MSTDEQAPAQPEPSVPAPAEERRWRQADHPTLVSLAGFFTGLVFIVVVPGTYAALLRAVVDQETAEELFALVLIALAVPVTLAIVPRTRRFGRYMLLGLVSTAVVVLGAAAIALWVLYRVEA